MKKYILLPIIIWLLYSSYSNEQPPCTDCFNVEWLDTICQKFIYPEGCPQCTIVVDYRVRIINDTCLDWAAAIGTKDIQIESIWRSPQCDICFNPKQLSRLVIDSLLRNNYFFDMGLVNPNTDTIWRFFQTACWGEWWDPLKNKYIIRGCLPDDLCCVEEYVYTFGISGEITNISRLRKYFSSPLEFLRDSCDKWTTPCWFACDSALQPPPPPLVNAIPGLNSFYFTKVNPQINEGIFNLEFSKEISGQLVDIRIHTLDGNLVRSINNYSVVEGEKLTIELTNVPRGLYFYKITNYNKVIDFGKFIIK